MVIPCSIGGVTVEAHVNPIIEVNIMPWHLAYILLGDVTQRPSDKLFKSCPFGHILEYRGVARAMPLTFDKIEVHLEFHIFLYPQFFSSHRIPTYKFAHISSRGPS